jgi:hypothetical protein
VKKLALIITFAIGVIGSAAAAVVDGTYAANLPGAGRCPSGLIVRLTVVQGQLSGVLVGANGTQTIDSLVLKPDGSFTGSTSSATGGSHPGAAFAVSGQFSGNAVTISASGGPCGTLTGQGTRTGG